MPLLDLFRDSPTSVLELTVEQAVKTAGDGDLRDGSACCTELREFLSEIPSEKLFEYVDQCLSSSFESSGFVLQDIVNELGRRLGYDVEYGVYRGRQSLINFDGIWRETRGSQIVIEVKTSDVYRIDLDKVAGYRSALLEANRITRTSSTLLVVGRGETGGLEAQIRGSKHAWDTRVISADSLTSLVRIKENTEEDATRGKIRRLLVPFEYTRLDNIVDVMFTATKDVESSLELDVQGGGPEGKVACVPTSMGLRTAPKGIALLRKRIVSLIGQRDRVSLIANTRAQFWTPDGDVRVVCAVSRRYDGQYQYWYGYHRKWEEFLNGGNSGYFALGCMDKNVAYVLPHEVISELLGSLTHSERPDGGRHWHVRLSEEEDGTVSILLAGEGNRRSIAEFELGIDDIAL